jgi:hypothetical protein
MKLTYLPSYFTAQKPTWFDILVLRKLQNVTYATINNRLRWYGLPLTHIRETGTSLPGRIRTIDVVPITHDTNFTKDYGMKAPTVDSRKMEL